MFSDPPDDPPTAAAQAAAGTIAPQPTLYLHGADDGCMGIDTIGPVTEFLAPGSEMVVVEGAGHFLHVERPDEVNDHILRFITAVAPRPAGDAGSEGRPSGQPQGPGPVTHDEPVLDQPGGHPAGPVGIVGPPGGRGHAGRTRTCPGAARRPAGPGPAGRSRRRRSGGRHAGRAAGRVGEAPPRRRPPAPAAGPGTPRQRGAPATQTTAPRSRRAWPNAQPLPAGTMASTRSWASLAPQRAGRPPPATAPARRWCPPPRRRPRRRRPGRPGPCRDPPRAGPAGRRGRRGPGRRGRPP